MQEEYKIGDIIKCKVTGIEKYGIFVNIDETYNVPGTSGDKNWSLRLPDNFEQMSTINLPLLLKKAIIARGKNFAGKHKDIIGDLDEIK